jgi:membrane fusion protein, multidrug efflux system
MDRLHRFRNAPACALAALVLAAAGCAGAPGDEAAREVPRNVRVMPLETASITEFLELAGPLQPVRGTDLGSEEAGTVATIVHDKGARVAAGATLLELDRRVLAAELAAAAAEAELQEYSHGQVERLHAAGKASRLELLQSAAQLARARSQRDVGRTRHERASIKAPYAGLVAARHVEPGQLVLPGTVVARIIDPYALKLEGTLTEREVAWVREGLVADVAVAGSPQTFGGVVAWVGFEAERSSGKFPVEIRVPNPDLALRSGVIGRARLAKRTTDHLVVIPRDAILPGERFAYVFVVEDDRAHRRQIVLGPDQGLLVAVRSGLAAGELLVVRGQRALRDGGLVAVTERVAYGDGTAADEPAAIGAGSAGTRVAGEVRR